MIRYKGHTFSDMDEVAEHYGLTFTELIERIQLSSEGEIRLAPGYYGLRKKDRYKFLDKTFGSLDEIVTSYGISIVTLMTRTKVGHDGIIRFKDEFTDFGSGRGVSGDVTNYVYGGVTYAGLGELADVTGVRINELERLVSIMEGNDVTEVVDEYISKARVFYVVDRDYMYVSELSRLLGLNRVRLDILISKGFGVEDSVLKLLNLEFLGAGDRSYRYAGEIVGSIDELYYMYVEIEESSLSFLEFVDSLRNEKLEESVSIVNNVRRENEEVYVWEGRTYYSMYNLAQGEKISYKALKDLAWERGSVLEAVREMKKSAPKKKYLYDGTYFTSLDKVAEYMGISMSVFNREYKYSGVIKKRLKDGTYARFYG